MGLSNRSRNRRPRHAAAPDPNGQYDNADSGESVTQSAFAQQPQTQLAPHGRAGEAGEPNQTEGTGRDMGVNARDIRMADFTRSYGRGYSVPDVDTFLTKVAVDVDRRDRQLEALKSSRGRSDEVDAIYEKARADARDILDHARTNAENGLRRARARAQEMLQDAKEVQQRASRLEAEVQLRLAHVERRLSEQASALAAEARRLDALADWMGSPDLVQSPDNSRAEDDSDATEGEIVPLRRVAEE